VCQFSYITQWCASACEQTYVDEFLDLWHMFANSGNGGGRQHAQQCHISVEQGLMPARPRLPRHTSLGGPRDDLVIDISHPENLHHVQAEVVLQNTPHNVETDVRAANRE